MSRTRLLFKVTHPDGAPFHGGTGAWPLPRYEGGRWIPGNPRPAVRGDLVACHNGYHYCTADQLLHWLGPTIHLVNVPIGMEELDHGDKLVGRGPIRLERTLTTWNERTARHFACDCAERVLHLTADPRPAEAIRAARLYADGLMGRRELDAAGDAAWAAWDAARAATWAARAAAWAARDARDAAWDAARAARDAAGDAEREWQTARLLHYLKGGAP